MQIDFSKNYYKILSIPSDASKDDIVLAYKALIKVYHPDNMHNSDTVQKSFEEKFKEIQEAYEILSNDECRCEYDAKRFNNSSSKHNYNSCEGGNFWKSDVISMCKNLHLSNTNYSKKSQRVDINNQNCNGCLFIIILIIVGFIIGFYFL